MSVSRKVPHMEDQMLEDAEDALDGHIARQRVEELETGAIRLVSGPELDARLTALSPKKLIPASRSAPDPVI